MNYAVLAAITYAILLESTLETMAHRSPVRWWLVGILVTYGAATAVSWRWTSWRVRTIASSFVLAATITITAWVPGGLDDGLRFLGLSTSALLCVEAVCGVTLAALVIVRGVRLSPVLAIIVCVVAAYGAGAFVQGAVSGSSFTSLFSGHSLHRSLPLFLQGAVLATFTIVPAAFIVIAIRAGVRRPGPNSTAYVVYQLAALTTSLAVALAALPVRHAPSPPRSTEHVSSGQVRAAPADDDQRTALLDDSLRALEIRERSAPRDRWDPAFVIGQVGRDPDALLAWVRSNTFWIPYHGELRGPVGVLMDRQGNSLDRAMLLATLLQKAGYTVRLAHRELSSDESEELLPRLIAERLDGLVGANALQPDVLSTDSDGHSPKDWTNTQLRTFTDLYSQLRARAADQADRLLVQLPKARVGETWDARLRAASEACRDHWWVQFDQGGAWIDLDPVAGPAPADRIARDPDRTMLPDEIPGQLRHEIAIRVIAEHWVNDSGAREEQVFERVIRPMDVVGAPLVLQFWPASWPTELNADPDARFGFRAAALEQTEWTAALLEGTQVAAQATIHATGDTHSLGTNPFGLGGGIAGALGSRGPRQPQSSNAPVLTAVWIEYAIRIPGQAPQTLRRTVFDLLGPARRKRSNHAQFTVDEAQRLDRSLALMMRTEILPMSAELAPEFVAHLGAESLLANRTLMRALSRGGATLDPTQERKLADGAGPAVSPLYAVALGRFLAGSTHVFIDRPNVLTRHQYPARTSAGYVLRDAVDIVANSIGIDPSEPDAFSARVAQGVFDTNTETLLHTGAGVVPNTADESEASRDWISISPADHSSIQQLRVSEDVHDRILDDLDANRQIVVPRQPATANGSQIVGWWQIDRVSGDTLGVGSNGWGQSLSERGVQYNWLWEVAKEFAFDYAFCQAVPQIANQTVIFLQQYRDELPPWLPPLAQARDAGALYRENKRGCLIGAMIGTGVTATLPFLIMALRPVARFMISSGLRGGGRLPPRILKGMPVKGRPGMVFDGNGNIVPAGSDDITLVSSYSKLGMSPKPKGNPVPRPAPASPGRPTPGQIAAADQAAIDAHREAMNTLTKAVRSSPSAISATRTPTPADNARFEQLENLFKAQLRLAEKLAADAQRLRNRGGTP
jgi:hypothetical protein